MGQGGSRLEKPNQEIFNTLQNAVNVADQERERLQTRYRRLLGLDTGEPQGPRLGAN